MPTPEQQVTVDATVVTELVARQHPDLADQPVVYVADGWDNSIFRLGEHLSVRLPRRAIADYLIVNEHRWAPELVAGLDLPVPIAVPLRTGEPEGNYPFHWTIGPWFDGETWERRPPEDLGAAARTLGTLLGRLHRPAPDEAPGNLYRGVPLAERDAAVHEGLATLGDQVDPDEVLQRWRDALEAPAHTGPRLWLHGDPHPLNLIVHDGALAAVIDLGDLCAGDPASDLAVAWMAFDEPERAVFRDALDTAVEAAGVTSPDEARWRRAHGWALALGVALAKGDDRVRTIGARTLRRALADDALR